MGVLHPDGAGVGLLEGVKDLPEGGLFRAPHAAGVEHRIEVVPVEAVRLQLEGQGDVLGAEADGIQVGDHVADDPVGHDEFADPRLFFGRNGRGIAAGGRHDSSLGVGPGGRVRALWCGGGHGRRGWWGRRVAAADAVKVDPPGLRHGVGIGQVLLVQAFNERGVQGEELFALGDLVVHPIFLRSPRRRLPSCPT